MAIQTISKPAAAFDALRSGFQRTFGCMPEAFFSAPGRTEIGGNHTDHQRGRVLAAAVNLDACAAVRRNGTRQICLLSEGYPLCRVELDDLAPRHAEAGTTQALVRGVAAAMVRLGCVPEGFDAYVVSSILPGSGLSSSAAFEVLLGTIFNALFFGGAAGAQQIALAGQFAENTFFEKPCGLMDQMASAVGGLVAIDFADPCAAVIRKISFDFAASGHALCIVDSRASHADLTAEYAAIPQEMAAVCRHFGAEVLTQVPQHEFLAALPQLRQTCGDRAVLRAMHFYEENARVPQMAAALERNDFDTFLRLVRESGASSFMDLQNVIPTGAVTQQAMAVALSLCRHCLGRRGAYRVHGGGFAGTVQAFVPLDLLDGFRSEIEAVLGPGACHILSIRHAGGAQMVPQEA